MIKFLHNDDDDDGGERRRTTAYNDDDREMTITRRFLRNSRARNTNRIQDNFLLELLHMLARNTEDLSSSANSLCTIFVLKLQNMQVNNNILLDGISIKIEDLFKYVRWMSLELCLQS